jgi:serine/threonine protein kinase
MIEARTLLQNRYRVERQIGQGGMGAVYVATDERFGSVVAIKETLVPEDAYLKAIEREARLLNSLKHAALPRVSDYFADENGQFIVMEYIAGEDLFELMARNQKPFPLADVLKWADQLLDALEFLHTQEIPIIHRDIKPQNLKLTARGQIILLDFGLAKGNPNDVSHQTAAKSIFGYSRNYASLEQIQGTGTDPRSDLYSLSATLYHLLTGLPPEDALTRAMHVLSEKADTLKPADTVHAQVPRGVAAILQNAMALNANNRPASAKEMRQMLRESEKYVDSTAPVILNSPTSVNSPLATDASMRETKLLPNALNNKTDIKTVILPGNLSQETAIKSTSGGTNLETANLLTTIGTSSDGTKRRTAFAVAFAGLVLAGTAASAAYLLKPEIFGVSSAGSETQQVQTFLANKATENVETKTAESNSANFIIKVENAKNALAKAETSKRETKTSGDAATKSTKNKSKNNKSGAAGKGENENDVEDVHIDGETVTVGDMKISEKGVEMPDAIITDKGVRRKNGSTKILSPEEIKSLMELQKSRMRFIMKRKPPIPPHTLPPGVSAPTQPKAESKPKKTP